LSDETKRIADILRSKIYEYKNKKDELKTIQFDSVASNSTLNIQFKDESKKINVEDLKILVAKIPNQVKIDNEETITLDKSANITSIKGTVSLKNIVKGANSNPELTKWEFISDKINTAETSVNSTALNITSTEKDTFTKANLETVARKLTETNITNTTINGTQKIGLNKDGSIKTISGEVSLKDVIEAKDEATTGLTNYALNSLKKNTNTDFESKNLKINTFYKTLKPWHTGSSISLLNTDNVDYSLTPVTLGFLKDMQKTALNKTSFSCKDGNKVIGTSFGNVSLDITYFHDEIENNSKLQEILNFPEDAIKETEFYLTGERTYETNEKHWDVTPYPKVDELLKIIENPALKDKIKIGETKLRGNVKDLLPYLLPGNTIEKTYGNITFPGYKETDCTGPNWVGYDGKIENTTERKILPGNEFLELQKRTNKGQSYIRNAIIKNVNSETKLEINKANWSNVTFENSNLSKISITKMEAHSTTLEFKDTILPWNMNQVDIKNLILNNVTFPKQEIMEYVKKGPTGIRGLAGIVPRVTHLEIYGYVKDSPLKDLTTEQLESLTPVFNMPSSYKGPKDIYDRLKTYIYKGESIQKEFGNFTSSLNKKPQSPVLLALLQGKADHTRG